MQERYWTRTHVVVGVTVGQGAGAARRATSFYPALVSDRASSPFAFRAARRRQARSVCVLKQPRPIAPGALQGCNQRCLASYLAPAAFIHLTCPGVWGSAKKGMKHWGSKWPYLHRSHARTYRTGNGTKHSFSQPTRPFISLEYPGILSASRRSTR